MISEVLYSSEYIMVTRQPDGIYIESFKKGISVDQFNKLMTDHSEIKITSFIAIKDALLFAPKSPVKFAELKERITVDISNDELKAYVTLCIPESELLGEKKMGLAKEIVRKLNENGITFGIKHDTIINHLSKDMHILVAEGTPPVNGEDSVVKLYELRDVRPEIKEDGSADHYELSLINKVKSGDWLGERRDPTNGTPGKSVMGNTLYAMPGKKFPIFYDKKSIREVYENGITTLYALRDGAVFYEGDRIGVSNHLEIVNNVDFKTGNIDFDGFLTVTGSVEDSFSVVANKDIEILGVYGVGSVKEIVSRGGSIFIKGGIAGRNKAIIRSKMDIYTKYISDATIICDGSVHIGFYCLNSDITAKEVILDSPKGQIIGGNIKADIKVVSSIIGSPSEKRTFISVKGFDRKTLKDRLERAISEIEKFKKDLNRSKHEISAFSNASRLNREQLIAYETLKDRFFDLKNDLKLLEDERKSLLSYLRTHGEGEIAILKKAYPGTILEIKKITREIDKPTLSTCFYIQDGEIREL